MNLNDRMPLVVLGDSHVRYFRSAYKHGLFYPRDASFCEISGATASGLRNPNSFTAASSRFKKFIGRSNKKSIFIFHLGEIDCGLLIWLRREKLGGELERSVNDSLDAYFSFLKEIASDITERGGRIVIAGATLPTITDDDRLGQVVNARRSKIQASQKECTELTLYFNERLRERARTEGYGYVDIKEHVLDPLTSLVSKSFRNSDPSDHHMDGRMAGTYWALVINDYLASFEQNLGSIKLESLRDTVVKSVMTISTELPDQLKSALSVGAIVTANLVGKIDKFLLLDSLQFQGRALPRHLRIVSSKHWRVLD